VPLDELRRAVAEDRVALLPVERELGGELKYTGYEVAERSGLTVEFLMRQRQALGLSRPPPAECAWTEDDLDAAVHIKKFLDAGLPEDGLLEVGRVVGESIARIADASRDLVGRALARPGDTERDLGLRLADATGALLPMIGPRLEYVYRVHLREQLRNVVLSQEIVAAGKLPGSQEITVCFADLVDFTKLGEALPPEELGRVAGQLTEFASEIAEPPVRLVKTVGDAAMLAGPEPAGVVSAALELVEATEGAGQDFPSIRSGVAVGNALERAGDWYGWPVNVASRVTGVARPSSVVTTREVHDAAEDQFRWTAIGRRKLKGLRDPMPLFRARFREDR
jgi:adenylate cyclase